MPRACYGVASASDAAGNLGLGMLDGLRRLFSDVDVVTRKGKVAALVVVVGFAALIGFLVYLFANGVDGGWAI